MTPHASTVWKLVQCRRMNAPPLRFKGIAIDWVESSLGENNLHVGLFQKKSGGFCVAYSCYQPPLWQPDAYFAESINDAADALETYCRDVGGIVARDTHEPEDKPLLAEALLQRLRLQSEYDFFARVVGKALHRWVSVDVSGPSNGKPMEV